jgi:hypothetical protein
VKDVNEPADFDAKIRLFIGLAHGCRLGILSPIEETGRDRPLPFFRAHGAPHEQDLSITHDGDANPNFRIGEVDEVTRRTSAAHLVADLACDELRSAVWTIDDVLGRAVGMVVAHELPGELLGE